MPAPCTCGRGAAGAGGAGAPRRRNAPPRPPARPPSPSEKFPPPPLPGSSSLINRTVNRPPQPLAVTAEEAQGWKTGCGGRRGCQASGGAGERRRGRRAGGMPVGRAFPWGKGRAGWGWSRGGPGCPHSYRSPARSLPARSRRLPPLPPGARPPARSRSCSPAPSPGETEGDIASGSADPPAPPPRPLRARRSRCSRDKGGEGPHRPPYSCPAWKWQGEDRATLGSDAGIVC